jgi:hypothetical protein
LAERKRKSAERMRFLLTFRIREAFLLFRQQSEYLEGEADRENNTSTIPFLSISLRKGKLKQPAVRRGTREKNKPDAFINYKNSGIMRKHRISKMCEQPMPAIFRTAEIGIFGARIHSTG